MKKIFLMLMIALGAVLTVNAQRIHTQGTDYVVMPQGNNMYVFQSYNGDTWMHQMAPLPSFVVEAIPGSDGRWYVLTQQGFGYIFGGSFVRDPSAKEVFAAYRSRSNRFGAYGMGMGPVGVGFGGTSVSIGVGTERFGAGISVSKIGNMIQTSAGASGRIGNVGGSVSTSKVYQTSREVSYDELDSLYGGQSKSQKTSRKVEKTSSKKEVKAQRSSANAEDNSPATQARRVASQVY